MFGQMKSYLYLCLTELVINPTGGATGVGESGRMSALYLYISPFFTNMIITLRVYFFYLILLLNNPPILCEFNN